MLTGISILATNGLDVSATPDAIETLALSVANHELDLAELASWLVHAVVRQDPTR